MTLKRKIALTAVVVVVAVVALLLIPRDEPRISVKFLRYQSDGVTPVLQIENLSNYRVHWHLWNIELSFLCEGDIKARKTETVPVRGMVLGSARPKAYVYKRPLNLGPATLTASYYRAPGPVETLLNKLGIYATRKWSEMAKMQVELPPPPPPDP